MKVGPFLSGRASLVLPINSQQLELGQVLRIDDPDRRLVIVNYHEVVDPVPLEQVQDFNRQLVLVNCDRIQRHQIANQAVGNLRVGLKVTNEIAVREDPEKLTFLV